MTTTPQRSYRKQMLSWHFLIIVVAWNSLGVDGKLELRWCEFCVCAIARLKKTKEKKLLKSQQ